MSAQTETPFPEDLAVITNGYLRTPEASGRCSPVRAGLLMLVTPAYAYQN